MSRAKGLKFLLERNEATAEVHLLSDVNRPELVSEYSAGFAHLKTRSDEPGGSLKLSSSFLDSPNDRAAADFFIEGRIEVSAADAGVLQTMTAGAECDGPHLLECGGACQSQLRFEPHPI